MEVVNVQSTPSFRQICASQQARRTEHPLLALAEKPSTSHSHKELIKLCIGDPTVDGNITCPECVTQACADAVRSGRYNGYMPVSGIDDTRKAVAEYMRRFCSTEERQNAIRWDQVIITSGVSHAITLALPALCEPGDNVLVGVPSFPHYKTVCDSYGIECRYYPLNADNHWECDLEAADKLVDNRTRAFVIINPSNPCGSNFSRSHVEEIIGFCNRHQLPLISDEIYAELVFSGETFTSVADFDTPVPRLVLNGTAKFHAVPGWRVAWTNLIDTTNAAGELMQGMANLANLIIGANSTAQITTARTLLNVPREHIDNINKTLSAGARVYERIQQENVGLTYQAPTASMFVMVRIDFTVFKDIENDMQFCEQLLDEENVRIIPGSRFGMSGFFRATISRPTEILEEAVNRIIDFCKRHASDRN